MSGIAPETKQDSTEPREEEAHGTTGHAAPSVGCGFLGKYPVMAVLSFALIGIGAGVGLSFWKPDNTETKDTLLKWVRLLTSHFIIESSPI
jgi:hypothetical protein